MRGLRPYLLALVAWVLMAAQGVAFAHTASYGDAPHEHDGVLCDVAVLEERADLVLPPPAAPVAAFVPAPGIIRTVRFASVDWLAAPARAPPGRAPPL